jgi:sugar phosphate isomerase/epimerase
MAIISAFADEIARDFAEQLRVIGNCGFRFIDLRSAWDTNVTRFSDRQLSEIETKLCDHGVRVAAIGSPIGKIRIDESWDRHLDDFRRVVDIAERLKARYVRIFSFYPPTGDSIENHRDDVIERLRRLCDFVADRPVRLVIENERGVFGDTPDRCADLIQTISSPKVGLAFDPGNFVCCGYHRVHLECWKPLREYAELIHIKDWKLGGDRGVPCGQGDGDIPAILRDLAADNFNGFLTLEPHLASGDQFGGHTGPDLFRVAVGALRGCCAKAALVV